MHDRPRNFVIIYSGRTGSSPVVNILARQPGICVPVFENLDRRFICAGRTGKLPGILDRVLATGALEGAELPPHLPRFPAGETPASVGFKWRPFGNWAKICEVFLRHRVTLFVLTRRDLVELASSLYITSHGNALQSEVRIDKHPQFGLAIGARADYVFVALTVIAVNRLHQSVLTTLVVVGLLAILWHRPRGAATPEAAE